MGHTIQETTVTVFIGNYIRRVNVIKGSLYSRVYGSIDNLISIKFIGLQMRFATAVVTTPYQHVLYIYTV